MDVCVHSGLWSWYTWMFMLREGLKVRDGDRWVQSDAAEPSFQRRAGGASCLGRLWKECLCLCCVHIRKSLGGDEVKDGAGLCASKRGSFSGLEVPGRLLRVRLTVITVKDSYGKVRHQRKLKRRDVKSEAGAEPTTFFYASPLTSHLLLMTLITSIRLSSLVPVPWIRRKVPAEIIIAVRVRLSPQQLLT